jgi:hypothetical protein
MSLNRRHLALSFAGALVATAAGRLPRAEAQARPPETFTGIVPGVAVGGYDPVAYFTEGRPVRGLAEITTRHAGAEWRFATAANRDAFLADPSRYAPRYGGHCSWAAAQGYAAKGDPLAWRIVDGRLYLNYDADIHRRWERDIPGFVRRADANWRRLTAR